MEKTLMITYQWLCSKQGAKGVHREQTGSEGSEQGAKGSEGSEGSESVNPSVNPSLYP